MTQDEIIKLARKAGFSIRQNQVYTSRLEHLPITEDIERFATRVAEATKEKATKVCEDYAEKCVEAENWEAEDVALYLDAAIRSMK